ncbi:MAG: hypothetical protein FD177_989 [Desulfovibrionaceae bacterium]|nr:MAG: hypothetical protein FD177_989 [Desulfovibrionaceae bacterium]
MLNAKMLFTPYNYGWGATFGGGSWLSELPASNLAGRILAEVARSTDVSLASTVIDVTLERDEQVQFVGLMGHTCSANALVRITGYSDSERTTLYPGAETAWLEMVPAYAPTASLPPEASNWLSGKPTARNLDRFPRNFFTILPAPKFTKWWRIEINDVDNTDGHIDVGQAMLAPVAQLTVNFLYGSNFGWASDTTFTKSKGGVKFFDTSDPFRVAGLQIQYMPQDEAYAVFLEAKRLLGLDREFFVSLMPQDNQYRHLFSFRANFAALSRMTWQTYLRQSWNTIEIQEAL